MGIALFIVAVYALPAYADVASDIAVLRNDIDWIKEVLKWIVMAGVPLIGTVIFFVIRSDRANSKRIEELRSEFDKWIADIHSEIHELIQRFMVIRRDGDSADGSTALPKE